MDLCLIGMVVGVIIFFAFVIFLIYSDIKKHHLITIPNADAIIVRQTAMQNISMKGFKVKDNVKETYIEEGTFSAASLIFIQEGPDVKIYRKNAATTIGLILTIVLAFTIFIGGLILAIYIDIKSSKLAKEKLLPILKSDSIRGRNCPSCLKSIPFDANICPFCGKGF